MADDHSKTGINNYVQSVPRVQIDFDLSKTKTGLLDAKDFLKNFQKQKCQGSFEHCKHLEPTVEDLSKLHKTYQKNIAEENEEDVEMIEEPVKNPELEVSNSSILTEKELKELDEVFDKYKDVHPVFIKSQSKSFEAEILPAHKNESEKKKEIAKSSQINTFPIFQKATKSSTSDLFGTQKEVPTNFSQNIFSDEMQKKQAQDEKEYMRLFYQQPKKSPPKVDNHVFSAPKVPKLSENHKTPSASATMSDLNDLIFGKRETPQPTDTEKEYSRKKRQNQENNEVPAEEPKKCDFKTAYSELRIQNQKVCFKLFMLLINV